MRFRSDFSTLSPPRANAQRARGGEQDGLRDGGGLIGGFDLCSRLGSVTSAVKCWRRSIASAKTGRASTYGTTRRNSMRRMVS